MSFILTFIILLVFWMLLSGEFDVVLITSAVVSCLLVSYMSHDLLIGDADIRVGAKRLIRFLKYFPWLFYQIILSNIDLVYRTLHPGMPIDPVIVKFKNDFKTEMGMAILANSITITPGTVTIEVNKNEFIVHAIGKEPAEGLLAGEMQKRVKEIEGE